MFGWFLVLVNAFHRDGMPPHSAPAILDRLNEITFNASVVLEVNAIEEINSILAELKGLACRILVVATSRSISMLSAMTHLLINSVLSPKIVLPRRCCPTFTMLATRLPSDGLLRTGTSWVCELP